MLFFLPGELSSRIKGQVLVRTNLWTTLCHRETRSPPSIMCTIRWKNIPKKKTKCCFSESATNSTEPVFTVASSVNMNSHFNLIRHNRMSSWGPAQNWLWCNTGFHFLFLRKAFLKAAVVNDCTKLSPWQPEPSLKCRKDAENGS